MQHFLENISKNCFFHDRCYQVIGTTAILKIPLVGGKNAPPPPPPRTMLERKTHHPLHTVCRPRLETIVIYTPKRGANPPKNGLFSQISPKFLQKSPEYPINLLLSPQNHPFLLIVPNCISFPTIRRQIQSNFLPLPPIKSLISTF